MAGSRVPIVVGILAIAAAITWFALRDRGSGDRTAADSGSAAPHSGSGRAAISAPEGPSLGSGASGGRGGSAGTPSAFDPPRPVLPDAGPPSHHDVFAAEARDPAWATRMEGELEKRVRTLSLSTVKGVECRASQCALTLSGPAETIEIQIARLESPKGLLMPVATSLLLGGPERTGDQLTMRVYALFDRPTEP